MMDDRIKIVDTALEEVGYKEKKSNKDLDSKTLNAGKNDIQNMENGMEKLKLSGVLYLYVGYMLKIIY